MLEYWPGGQDHERSCNVEQHIEGQQGAVEVVVGKVNETYHNQMHDGRNEEVSLESCRALQEGIWQNAPWLEAIDVHVVFLKSGFCLSEISVWMLLQEAEGF